MSRIDDIIRDAVRDVINSSACDFKNWWKDEFETEVYFETKEDLEKLSDNDLEKNTTEVDLPKCRGGKTGPAGKWYYEFDKSKCHDLNDYLAANPHLTDF